jgi:hypothetical protein
MVYMFAVSLSFMMQVRALNLPLVNLVLILVRKNCHFVLVDGSTSGFSFRYKLYSGVLKHHKTLVVSRPEKQIYGVSRLTLNMLD